MRCLSLTKLFTGSYCYYLNRCSMTEGPSPKKIKLDDGSDVESKQDASTGSSTASSTADNQISDLAKHRLLKRKCIILLSYCGKGYMGMQRNRGVPTIEEELLQALSKADAIPADLKDWPSKLLFQRCARTDKGVSAARQVMVPDPGLIPEINKNLPDQIRVVGIKRVTKGFNSKNACTSRVYEYLLPTYAVSPLEETNFNYRINATLITRLQKLLNFYLGTHNFHNFTAQKRYEDPSAKRYIMSFNVGHPFVRSDVEFVSLTIEGQSFMLHQIRKMIGYVIAIMRGFVGDDMMSEAFDKPKIDIPRAPALGLLLDSINYRIYNLRYGEDGSHEKLDWLEYEDTVSAFKENHIYRIMIDTELRELTMMKWLDSLHLHNFYQTRQTLAEKQKVSTLEEEKVSTQEEEKVSTLGEETVSTLREEKVSTEDYEADASINEVTATE